MTKDDEKIYWGKISYADDHTIETKSRHIPSKNEVEGAAVDENQAENSSSRRLCVEGSVIFGYGLEPLPVARFIMTETTEIEDFLEDDSEDDENDVEEPMDDFSDWSNAFQ